MLFQACQVEEIRPLIQEYTQTLSSPIDSFLEEHILSSDFYVILEHSTEIGYYAIRHGRLLTQFYVRPSYLKSAQELFAQVIQTYNVESLYVPTCDELFISLALDRDFHIIKQAYFFQDSQQEITENESLKGDVFGPATIEDLLPMQGMCGDFLDQYEQRIANGELFTYYRGSVLLGVGVLEKSRLLEGFASMGMFTNENYRREGIGRNLILKLKKWCYDQQLVPICGCWYYNEASKRTLESAGMVTRTRLFNMKVNLPE
jgi:GNAT superfamily N-acetyltransferase